MRSGKYAFLAITALLSLNVSGCNTANKTDSENHVSQHAISYYGHQVDGKQLMINVASNGCTTAKDIAGNTEWVDGEQQVLLWRLQADPCRRMPYVAKVAVNPETLGLDLQRPFRITNAIAPALGKKAR
jgi:hypothetical protein